MLGFQGGVSIPLVKGGVKAPPAKRQCRAAPKAWLDAALPGSSSLTATFLLRFRCLLYLSKLVKDFLYMPRVIGTLTGQARTHHIDAPFRYTSSLEHHR